jgi:predicted porin
MKKLLIAAAAMSVVAGAQAQSSATLYGTLDMGYGSFSSQAGTAAKVTQSGLMSNNDNSSRWGINATEDIGGGVKAGVTIESWIGALPRANFGYAAAAGITGSGTTTFATSGVGNTIDATSIGNRLLFAELSSGANKVRLGQQSSFVRDVSVGFQSDGSNNVGNLIANDSVLAGRYMAATYMYSANGVTLGAAVMNNTKEQTNAADLKTGNGYSLMGRYTAGALDIGAAYQEAKTDTAAVTGSTGIANDGSNTLVAAGAPVAGTSYLIAPVAAAAAKQVKTKATSVGASYNLGAATPYVQYGKVTTDNTMAAAVDSSSNERHAYSVGVRTSFGKLAPFAQISQGKATNGTAQYKGDWDGYTVGARYNLSKRTYAYVVTGETNYDYSATATLKAKQYSAGVAHSF